MNLRPRNMKAIGYLSWPLLMTAALSVLISRHSPHSLVFAIVGIVALVFVALCHISRGYLGVLSPFPLFMLGGALYTLPTALTLAASGELVNVRDIPIGAIIRAISDSSVALLCAASGYLVFNACTRQRMRIHRQKPLLRDDSTAATIGGLLMVIGVAAAAQFVFNVAGFNALRSASYGGRYVLMDGHGLLIGCISWISLGGLVLCAHFLHRGSRLKSIGGLLLAGAALVLWTFLIGSRSHLIQFCIAAIVVRQITWKPSSLKVLAAIGTFVIAAAILFEMSERTFSFSAIRLPQKDQIKQINPANSELGAPVQTLADIERSVPSIEPFQFGRTYLEIPAILVPKIIWPGRPQGPGIWYASRFYPRYAEAGGAYAFSPVAEAYLNFGPIGIVLSFVAVGAILGLLERKLMYPCGLSIWAAVAYAVTVPYIIMFSRLDAATFVKSLCVGTLAPLFISAAGGRFLREMFRPPKLAASENSLSGLPAMDGQNQVEILDTQH